MASGTNTYTFVVTAVNPGATGFGAGYSSVSISIPTQTGTYTITTTNGTTATVPSGSASVVSSGPWANPTFTFTVKFGWGTEVTGNATRPITATVVDS
ncbi:MAG TPA: hypothetical protein VF857_02690, partial [Spirochaetota bacterium]